jgi:hypothetical protein
MSFYEEYKRRSLVPLTGLALALYYGLVFVPLHRKAEGLDAPLQRSWQKLSGSLGLTNALALDFLHVTNQLAETRRALAQLESARQKATTRLELGPSVRARLNAPFQLVEYENERSMLVDSLIRLAREQQITIEPAVLNGLPEHTADMQQPALLWAALSLVDHLLTGALHARVAALHSLEVPLSLTNAPASEGAGRWAEIPLQIEFTAPATAAARLLQSLPLRADEIRAAGLPETKPDKPPLFIDRLAIRKQSPDKPDEVRVWLRLTGFVFRE